MEKALKKKQEKNDLGLVDTIKALELSCKGGWRNEDDSFLGRYFKRVL